jgi:hypothetical protein
MGILLMRVKRDLVPVLFLSFLVKIRNLSVTTRLKNKSGIESKENENDF